MLYPLSYEGLTGAFAQLARQVSVRRARAGWPRSQRSVPHLCRVPWASMSLLPQHAALIVRWVGEPSARGRSAPR
jgi:hypothetical protein